VSLITGTATTPRRRVVGDRLTKIQDDAT
jgi:hypothetical protein